MCIKIEMYKGVNALINNNYIRIRLREKYIMAVENSCADDMSLVEGESVINLSG